MHKCMIVGLDCSRLDCRYNIAGRCHHAIADDPDNCAHYRKRPDQSGRQETGPWVPPPWGQVKDTPPPIIESGLRPS